MSSSISHCSLSYHHLGIDVLDVFSVGVRDGVFNNKPPFDAPPTDKDTFQKFIDSYINTRGAYVQGGLAQKGPFQEAKAALLKTLDTFADFVDGIAKGNVNIITLGGFVPTKIGSTEHHAPEQPKAAQIKRGATGELFAEVPVVAGAEWYGCIVFAGMPMPSALSLNAVGQLVVAQNKPQNPEMKMPETNIIALFDLNKNRKKKFSGLQSHVTYYFYFYAANATGVSPLSEVSSLECL